MWNEQTHQATNTLIDCIFYANMCGLCGQKTIFLVKQYFFTTAQGQVAGASCLMPHKQIVYSWVHYIMQWRNIIFIIPTSCSHQTPAVIIYQFSCLSIQHHKHDKKYISSLCVLLTIRCDHLPIFLLEYFASYIVMKTSPKV